jgi:phage-related protein
MPTDILRPLAWVGSSKKDYIGFPPEVQDDFGHLLYLVQIGTSEVLSAKPLSGGLLRGLGIMEMRSDHDSDTYRVVYLAKFAEVVYVLHAFQKKSTHGIATPQREIEMVRARYGMALEHYRRTVRPR